MSHQSLQNVAKNTTALKSSARNLSNRRSDGRGIWRMYSWTHL